jgi:predicted Rossmann fold nucleotide-binding protein DprA/Smf involved in DNA uptake
VGSRDIAAKNKAFAAEVGRQAALQGYTLVSGNARGADRTAQRACLQHGGKVISIVADELDKQQEQERVLYISEEDFDASFSAQRAHSRNRVIHALADKVFVAQSGLAEGGTWAGTVKNLRCGWSPVFCFRDGSEASRQLEEMGAYLIGKEDLKDFGTLPESDGNFLT